MASVCSLVALCAFYVLAFIPSGQTSIESSAACPLLGPAFPAPRAPHNSTAIRSACYLFDTALKAAFSHPTVYGQLDPNSTSFSIDLYSAADGRSLYTHHYSAPDNAHPADGSAASVDSNTVYRLGSVSKLLTAYTFLVTAGDISFNEPVTNFIPELATYAALNAATLLDSDIDTFDFADITLAFPQQKWQSWVFHQSQRRTSLSAAYLEWTYHAIEALSSLTSSSNIPLENITSTSFPNIFMDSLIKPLKLNATTYAMPTSNCNSVIPINASISYYDIDTRDETPAGGYHSSLKDMRKVGVSILHSTLLTPSQTRRWMKPQAFTSNPNVSVGAPWEILRAPSARNSWLYTKAGNLGLYTSQLALMPDHNAGFTVLTAGQSGDDIARIVSDMIASIFVPAFEEAAREEASAIYSGTYSSGNSSITITTDSQPGLLITSWTNQGSDFFSALASLNAVSADQTVGSDLSVRLYPTGLNSNDGTKVSYRAVYTVMPQALDPGAFSFDCWMWVQVDQVTYGGIGQDEFVFNFEKGRGRAVSVEPRVLRTQLRATKTLKAAEA
ncbi:hypothetical protein LTR65_006954 [Meristemomyces frigidus]